MSKEKIVAALCLLPFFVILFFFMILPLIYIFIDAFWVELDEKWGFDNFTRILDSKFYMQSIKQILQISFISSCLGLVIGLFASYSLYALKEGKIAKAILAYNAMISNFAGVPLAFAFIIVLGSNGVFNVFLKSVGIEPFFSVYENLGINIVYVYFQIPLAILLLFPVFKSLDLSHKQASSLLGANIRQYSFKIALPLLAPAIISVFVVLFANALGAYATIYALSAGNFNLIPIRIAALIAGDINLDPYLASALSLFLVVIMAFVTLIGNFLSKKYDFKALK